MPSIPISRYQAGARNTTGHQSNPAPDQQRQPGSCVEIVQSDRNLCHHDQNRAVAVTAGAKPLLARLVQMGKLRRWGRNERPIGMEAPRIEPRRPKTAYRRQGMRQVSAGGLHTLCAIDHRGVEPTAGATINTDNWAPTDFEYRTPTAAFKRRRTCRKALSPIHNIMLRHHPKRCVKAKPTTRASLATAPTPNKISPVSPFFRRTAVSWPFPPGRYHLRVDGEWRYHAIQR